MNSAFMLTTHIEFDGGLALADVERLHFWLNETPMSATAWTTVDVAFSACWEEPARMPDRRRF